MNVEFSVNGKSIPLNSFTQQIIGNVSVAMAESLRGVGKDWREISIRVKQE